MMKIKIYKKSLQKSLEYENKDFKLLIVWQYLSSQWLHMWIDFANLCV